MQFGAYTHHRSTIFGISTVACTMASSRTSPALREVSKWVKRAKRVDLSGVNMPNGLVVPMCASSKGGEDSTTREDSESGQLACGHGAVERTCRLTVARKCEFTLR